MNASENFTIKLNVTESVFWFEGTSHTHTQVYRHSALFILEYY